MAFKRARTYRSKKRTTKRRRITSKVKKTRRSRSTNTSAHSSVVSHTEYIGDLLASTGFAISKFSINPGDGNAFPWLSSIAINYETYKFQKLRYLFKSSASDAIIASNASGGLGIVGLAVTYDATDPLFSNKFTMNNYQGTQTAKPSANQIITVDCKRAILPDGLFVRDAMDITSTTDIRFSDLGSLFISVNGTQASTGTIGELWVDYRVKLMKPKLVMGAADQNDKYILALGVNNATPFGSVYGQFLQSLGSGIGTSIANGTSLAFPPTMGAGRYVISMYWIGGATPITTPNISYYNAQPYALFKSSPTVNIASYASPNTGATSNILSLTTCVEIIGLNATFSLNSAVLPLSVTMACILVSEINSEIV